MWRNQGSTNPISRRALTPRPPEPTCRCACGLSFDHFLLVCNFPLAADLEKCVGPDTIFEVDAILRMVLVIFMGAHPLVVDVRKLLFQIRPGLVAFFHDFLSGSQGRNGHQCYDKKYAYLHDCEPPP